MDEEFAALPADMRRGMRAHRRVDRNRRFWSGSVHRMLGTASRGHSCATGAACGKLSADRPRRAPTFTCVPIYAPSTALVTGVSSGESR